MKILLTGMGGFVGSHVSNYLATLGYEIDNISTNEFMNNDWSKLDGQITIDSVKSVDKKNKVVNYRTSSTRPDVVIHIAWIKEQDLNDHKHIEFAEMSCNFLDECKKRGIRVINIGSSSEYGVKYEPMREDMICEPINTYGIGKLMVTLHAKNLGYNTLRLFSPYGEGGKNFVSLYKDAEKFGDPNDSRDYQPIEKVCYAIERLIHAKHIYGEIINVCRGESIQNRKIILEAIRQEGTLDSQYNKRWHKYPQRQYEPSLWIGDTAKMKKLLNI